MPSFVSLYVPLVVTIVKVVIFNAARTRGLPSLFSRHENLHVMGSLVYLAMSRTVTAINFSFDNLLLFSLLHYCFS
jgi:hypothetical protein